MSGKEGIIEAFPAGQVTIRQRRPQKWYHLFGKDVSYVPVDDGLEGSSETSSLDDAVVKNTNNVYEAPEAADIYRLVDGFEGTHRFDPSATWTQQEETQLVRRVCPLCRTCLTILDAHGSNSWTGVLLFLPV
jgi:hypothetical protein